MCICTLHVSPQAILCSAPPSEVHSLLSHVMEGLVEAVNTAKLSYPVEERERMAGEDDKVSSRGGACTAVVCS